MKPCRIAIEIDSNNEILAEHLQQLRKSCEEHKIACVYGMANSETGQAMVIPNQYAKQKDLD